MKKILTIIFASIIYYNCVTAQNYGSWVSFDSLTTARQFHAAILLSNGNILVAGGDNGEVLSSCEIYDVNDNKWRSTSSMNYPRYDLSMVRLLDDRVLAISGKGIKSCELFDPITETWSITDSLFTKRHSYDLNTILLDDGRVLVTGGSFINNELHTSGYLNVCEIYDPSTNKWSLTDTLKSKRAGHTMTKLKDGRILVAGGFNENELFINKCEIFDPNTNTWSSADSLDFARNAHSAILLPDGKVLVAGGEDGVNPTDPWLSSCELYNPDTDEWTVVGSLSVSRTDAKAFFVSDNLIMYAGGVHNAHLWELYDINQFETVYLDTFPVDKFDQEILVTKNISLISIGGIEEDMSGGMPLLLPSNKCEIYRFGVTDIDEEKLISQDYILHQNYPNPFNPTTVIAYYLPTGVSIELRVYDILGNEIMILEDGFKSPGYHEVQFDGSGFSSGIYIYQLSSGTQSISKKMILAK
ncbi:MAG: kelch repeat-containing protein [Ignavibacteria bacterium]|jgi:N-acetylneuraminic acid mutarotase